MNLAHDTNSDFDRSPDEWKTRDDPATQRQRDYLSTLAAKAGGPISEEELDSLTKAEASERIDELLQ